MDLGLELLMNPKKRTPSENGSVVSGPVSSIKSISLDKKQYASGSDEYVNDDYDDESVYEDGVKVNEINDGESDISFISSRSSQRKQHQQRQQQRHHARPTRQHVISEYSDSGSGSGSGSESGSGSGSDESKSDIESLGSMLVAGEKQESRRRMSEEEIINAKREILYQFDRLEKKGMKLPKRFTLASSLEDMKLEYDRLKRDRDLDNSIKFQRKALMMFSSGVEFLNSKFDPFDVKLDGWSESIHESIDDYDDVFEELYEKYKGKGKMAPEVKLLFALGGSAFMFHMTNSMFKNAMPGLDQVLKSNPDLMKQFAAATASTMKQQQPQGSMFGGLGSMFSNMFGGDSSKQSGGSGMPMPQPPPQPSSNGFNMRGPSNIDDIMKDLERSNDNDRIEVMSTVSSSEFTELQDDVSINNLVYNGKKKKGGKKITLDL